MFAKIGRDEVLMASHMGIGFFGEICPGVDQGNGKKGQLGALSPKDFFLRLEGYSNKLNA